MDREPPRSSGERHWRSTLFFLSAALAATALVDVEAGRIGRAIGDLGACVLLLSLIVQFPFLRALVKAGEHSTPGSPEELRRQREALMQQAERVRLDNPWAERAGRAGWVLLAISLLLRIGGVA
jgi:hypothetical protein